MTNHTCLSAFVSSLENSSAVDSSSLVSLLTARSSGPSASSDDTGSPRMFDFLQLPTNFQRSFGVNIHLFDILNEALLITADNPPNGDFYETEFLNLPRIPREQSSRGNSGASSTSQWYGLPLLFTTLYHQCYYHFVVPTGYSSLLLHVSILVQRHQGLVMTESYMHADCIPIGFSIHSLQRLHIKHC